MTISEWSVKWSVKTLITSSLVSSDQRPQKYKRGRKNSYAMTHEIILRKMQLYIDAVGYQKQTKHNILRGIKDFLLWLPCALEKVNRSVLKAYHQYLEHRPKHRGQGGISAQSIQLNFWYLRLFFGHLQRSQLIKNNPASSYTLAKVQHQKRQILSHLDIEQLYTAAQQIEELLTLDLFYGLGLRRSEGEALNLADIDLKNDWLYIRKSKHGGSRRLPIHQRFKQHLELYLSRRIHQKSTALILNRDGNRMRGASYMRRFKNILKRSQLTKKVDLHCLRHSIATHLLQAGMPIEQLRDYLGHRHLESTQNYLHYGYQDLFGKAL